MPNFHHKFLKSRLIFTTQNFHLLAPRSRSLSLRGFVQNNKKKFLLSQSSHSLNKNRRSLFLFHFFTLKIFLLAFSLITINFVWLHLIFSFSLFRTHQLCGVWSKIWAFFLLLFALDSFTKVFLDNFFSRWVELNFLFLSHSTSTRSRSDKKLRHTKGERRIQIDFAVGGEAI